MPKAHFVRKTNKIFVQMCKIFAFKGSG